MFAFIVLLSQDVFPNRNISQSLAAERAEEGLEPNPVGFGAAGTCPSAGSEPQCRRRWAV